MLRVLGFSSALALAFLAGTLMPSASTQTMKTPYLRVDFMKIPPGQALKYRDLESKLWKPVHELRVKRGLISSWRLYGHHFPGGGQDYQYVTVTEFPTFQSMEENHYPELFKAVHNAEYNDEISKQTDMARTLTHTDIWALIDQVK